MARSHDISVMTYLPPRGVDSSIDYQRYYLMGFQATTGLRVEPRHALMFPAPRIESRLDAHRFKCRVVAKLPLVSHPRISGHTGCYVARIRGGEVRFAIDARDSHPIHDPEELDWSDLFFKANAWPHAGYDPKVVRIVNGNGVLTRRRIAFLRSLRRTPKDIDVVFISNVWGGVEHNIRLFEELAETGVSSNLHAIFPWGSDPETTTAAMARLRVRGISVGRTPIPSGELWRKLARAKLVFFRSGMHLCIPWRTLDLLCLGACIVLDAPFVPQWPEPLRPDVNYVDCGIRRPLDGTPVAEPEYEKVGETVAAVLSDPARAEAVRLANAQYFDDHAAPERVASYVLGKLADRVAGGLG